MAATYASGQMFGDSAAQIRRPYASQAGGVRRAARRSRPVTAPSGGPGRGCNLHALVERSRRPTGPRASAPVEAMKRGGAFRDTNPCVALQMERHHAGAPRLKHTLEATNGPLGQSHLHMETCASRPNPETQGQDGTPDVPSFPRKRDSGPLCSQRDAGLARSARQSGCALVWSWA